MSVYQAGGALTADHARVYIERQADQDLRDGLGRMDYLMVIEPRQQGKTSLMQRLRYHAPLDGYAFTYIDTSTMDHSSEARWYGSLCRRMLEDWAGVIPPGGAPPLPEDAPGWRVFLSAAANAAVQAGSRLVVILDEIGAVSFPGVTGFFSVLRDIYNSRTSRPEFGQITFVLVGAFHPRDLIQDDQVSPFNVAQRVALSNFTCEQVGELVQKGGWPPGAADALAQEIYDWAGGQPYLTQWLCGCLLSQAAEASVAAAVERLRREDRNHIPHIVDILEKTPDISGYMADILRGKSFRFYPSQNRRQGRLELLGVIRCGADGCCQVSSRLYREVLADVLEIDSVPEPQAGVPQPQAGAPQPTLAAPPPQAAAPPPAPAPAARAPAPPGWPAGASANLEVELFDYRQDENGVESYQVRASCAELAGTQKLSDADAVVVPGDARDLLGALKRRLLRPQEIVELGKILGQMLLPPRARWYYEQSRARLGENRVLRVRVKADHSALASIAWEYAYVPPPDTSPGFEDPEGFLVLDPRISLVRYEMMAKPMVSLDPLGAGDLRVALFLANARDPSYDPLDLKQERKNISAALEGIPAVKLEVVPNATIRKLQDALRVPAHVFHFAGHGGFINDQGELLHSMVGEGVIILQGKTVEESILPARTLALNLRGRGVRLAVLGSCESAQRDTVNAWTGVAPALIRAGIPAVVAMQFKVYDRSALEFHRSFYRSLSAGRSIDAAVSDGRLAVYSLPGADRDWGVPALYLYSDDGVIFPRAVQR